MRITFQPGGRWPFVVILYRLREEGMSAGASASAPAPVLAPPADASSSKLKWCGAALPDPLPPERSDAPPKVLSAPRPLAAPPASLPAPAPPAPRPRLVLLSSQPLVPLPPSDERGFLERSLPAPLAPPCRSILPALPPFPRRARTALAPALLLAPAPRSHPHPVPVRHLARRRRWSARAPGRHGAVIKTTEVGLRCQVYGKGEGAWGSRVQKFYVPSEPESRRSRQATKWPERGVSLPSQDLLNHRPISQRSNTNRVRSSRKSNCVLRPR